MTPESEKSDLCSEALPPSLQPSSPSLLHSPQSASRDQLLATAAKFLANPEVLAADADKKRRFLRSKGLTDDEIENAFHSAHGAFGPPRPLPPPLTQTVIPVERFSPPWWTLIFLAGSLGYGAYFIYTNYVTPFLKRQRRVDKKMAVLEECIVSLQDNVALTMKSVQESVERLELSLQLQSSSSATMESRLRETQAKALTELRSEILSVKGLLLNARNFPTPKQLSPSVEIPPAPPAWQLTSTSAAGTEQRIGKRSLCLEPFSAGRIPAAQESVVESLICSGRDAKEGPGGDSASSGSSAASFEVVDGREDGAPSLVRRQRQSSSPDGLSNIEESGVSVEGDEAVGSGDERLLTDDDDDNVGLEKECERLTVKERDSESGANDRRLV